MPDPGRDLESSVADPGSGAFFAPGFETRDGTNIGSEIRNKHPGSYSRSLVTIVWVKNSLILCAGPDPGSEIHCLFDPGSGMEKVGSEISDPG